jgi:hypothetical protein
VLTMENQFTPSGMRFGALIPVEEAGQQAPSRTPKTYNIFVVMYFNYKQFTLGSAALSTLKSLTQ